ncbi:MAG: HEAT repeat domain-containing protein, partial [bacterium]
LLYPLTTLVGLAGMIISPAFYSAIFLRFNNKNLQESIRNPINALLYNALPTNTRSRVGAIMAGQVVAVASILSGVLLLIIKPTGLALLPLSPRWLAAFSFLIAIAYMSAGFLLRREYGAALRKMLEDRNLGLFQFAQEGFGAIDQDSLAILVKNVHEGDGDLCIYAAGMLAEMGHPEAVDEILDEIPRRSGSTLCSLIRLLAQTKTGKEDERVRALWTQMLGADEPEYRCAAMDAVAEAEFIDDYVEQIQECLNFPSPVVRAQAVQLLVRSDDLFWLAAGLQTLHTMLETGQPDEKICALRCIGELENPRFVRRVIPFLDEPDVAVREAAMEAAERLIPAHAAGDKRMDEVIQTALMDPHPSIRRRGVRLLGGKETRSNFERLLVALSDPEPMVRHEAVVSLKVMKGRGALTLEGGALFSLLGRWLAPARNGETPEVSGDDLINGLTDFSLEHLREVYEIINHLHTIEQIREGDSFIMLRKILRDKVRDRQALVLELLGAIGDEKTVDTVSESLALGERTSRAIAIETLSNVNAVGDIRHLILMLEPLLLGGNTSEILAEGRKSWNLAPIEFGKVLQIHMDSLDPWTRAVAVNAAGHFLAEDESILLAEEGTIGKNRKEWINRFQALAQDEDFYVREAAVSALGLMRIRDGHDPEVLESALLDAEDRVRIQARKAIERIEEARSGSDQPPKRKQETAREMLSTIEKALFLRGVTLFEPMTADQLKILSNISREIHVSPGEVLFHEGEPCDYLYVIVDGEIEIVRNPGDPGEDILAILKRPSSFGEIALFGSEGRSAAARAANEVTLLGIEKDPLLVLIQEHPEISVAIIFQLTSIVRHQDEARAALVQHDPED